MINENQNKYIKNISNKTNSINVANVLAVECNNLLCVLHNKDSRYQKN